MKILVVCQNYYPEPFRISDICEELVKRGNEVSVITGVPNYPLGKIYDGYEKGKKREEIIKGVKVHRTFTIGRSGGIIKRFLNYYSFAISSKKYVKKLKEEFDVVFVNQLSPVMMANAGIFYAKKHKVPLIMYVMDLWPASLVAGGISRKNPIHKYYHKVSEKIYRKADRLLITSICFSDYLFDEFGISKEKITYLPQYAEDTFDKNCCKKTQNEFVDLMFAGNIGYAQSVETIIKAAAECKDMTNVRWHVVGDGSEYEKVKRLSEASNLKNVIFYGRQPVEQMPEFYAKADAMLVTLMKDSFLSMTLPGKVQSYMAAGKPIIGAADGETAKVIEEARCGYCVPATDYVALAETVKRFCADIENGRYQSYCENARKFYVDTFEKEKFMKKLEAVLSE